MYTVEASLETVASKEADAFLIYANSEEPTDTPDGTKEAQFLFSTFPNMQASKDRRVIVTDYTFTARGARRVTSAPCPSCSPASAFRTIKHPGSETIVVAQFYAPLLPLRPAAFDQPSDTHHQHTDIVC